MTGRRLAVMAVCLIALAFHAVTISRAGFENDEFEHVHAAWLVSTGQIPYADFFEHHAPLFYFLGAAVIPFANPGFDTMLLARWLAFGFSMLTAVVSWFWLKRYGSFHSLLIVSLLAANFFLLRNAGLVFLDTFSTPFLVLSAFLIAAGEKRLRWMALAGLCFGLAVLFNVKAAMAVFAPIALLAMRGASSWSVPGRRRQWLLSVLAYGLGGLASILIVALLLGPAGLEGLWRYVVAMNVGWKAHRSGIREILDMAWGDPFVFTAAVAALLYRGRSLLRRRFIVEEQDVPALFLASLGVGFFLLPVVWREYIVTLVPFLVLVAAQGVAECFAWWERTSDPAPVRRIALASLCALLFFAALAVFPYRAIFRGDRLALVQSAVILTGTAALAFAIKRYDSSRWWFQRSLCLALVTVAPLTRTALYLHRHDNKPQREQLEYVMANTRPDEAVFDGYSGFGVFRPHAYKYWLLHEEVLAMLSLEEKTRGIIESLEAKRPPIVISDAWVRSLPPEVGAYLKDAYVDTPLRNLKRRKPGWQAPNGDAGYCCVSNDPGKEPSPKAKTKASRFQAQPDGIDTGMLYLSGATILSKGDPYPFLQRAPLYPAFLAGLGFFTGAGKTPAKPLAGEYGNPKLHPVADGFLTPAFLRLAFVAQLLLYGLSVLFVADTLRVAGLPARWIMAASLACLLSPGWALAWEIHDHLLNLFLITAGVVALARAWRGPTHLPWIAASSLAFALSGLSRPTFQLLSPVLLAILVIPWLLRFGRRSTLALSLLMLTPWSLLCLGWSIRNHKRHGVFGVTGSFGLALSSKASPYLERAGPAYADVMPVFLMMRDERLVNSPDHVPYAWSNAACHWLLAEKHMSYVEADRYLARMATAAIRNAPLRYVRSVFDSMVSFCWPRTPFERGGAIRFLYAIFDFLLIASFLGVTVIWISFHLLARFAFRKEAPLTPVDLLIAIVAAVFSYAMAVSSVVDNSDSLHRVSIQFLPMLATALAMWRLRTHVVN